MWSQGDRGDEGQLESVGLYTDSLSRVFETVCETAVGMLRPREWRDGSGIQSGSTLCRQLEVCLQLEPFKILRLIGAGASVEVNPRYRTATKDQKLG